MLAEPLGKGADARVLRALNRELRGGELRLRLVGHFLQPIPVGTMERRGFGRGVGFTVKSGGPARCAGSEARLMMGVSGVPALRDGCRLPGRRVRGR